MGWWRVLTRISIDEVLRLPFTPLRDSANQNPHPVARKTRAGRVGHPSAVFGYGNEASAGNTLPHFEVGTPAKLEVPVIVEFESQNKSTALPPIRDSKLLLPALTSMLDRFASTRPPWPLPVTLAPARLA